MSFTASGSSGPSSSGLQREYDTEAFRQYRKLQGFGSWWKRVGKRRPDLAEMYIAEFSTEKSMIDALLKA